MLGAVDDDSALGGKKLQFKSAICLSGLIFSGSVSALGHPFIVRRQDLRLHSSLTEDLGSEAGSVFTVKAQLFFRFSDGSFSSPRKSQDRRRSAGVPT